MSRIIYYAIKSLAHHQWVDIKAILLSRHLSQIAHDSRVAQPLFNVNFFVLLNGRLAACLHAAKSVEATQRNGLQFPSGLRTGGAGKCAAPGCLHQTAFFAVQGGRLRGERPFVPYFPLAPLVPLVPLFPLLFW